MGSDMQQRDPGRESNPGPLQSLRHMGRARYRLSYAAPRKQDSCHIYDTTTNCSLRDFLFKFVLLLLFWMKRTFCFDIYLYTYTDIYVYMYVCVLYSIIACGLTDRNTYRPLRHWKKSLWPFMICIWAPLVYGVDLQYGSRPAAPSVLWAVICFTRLTVSRSRCHPHGHIYSIERVSKVTVWTGELHKHPGKQSLHHCEELGKLTDNQYYHCQLLLTWGKDTL